MKHILSAMILALIVSATMAQSVSPLRDLISEPTMPLVLRQAQHTKSDIPDFSTNTVTSHKIGSSSNFYGYSNGGQKQCYILNDLNTVAFVFRNNPAVSNAGNSGHIRYNVSSDRGLTWASPILNSGAGIGNINPTQPKLARYPDCFLISNGTGTANVHLGMLAASLNSSGTGWEGYLKSAVAPNIFTNITTPNIEQEDYYLSQGAVFPQHITERVLGEYWATMYSSDSTNDTLYVIKGMYNATSQSVQWQYHDKLIPSWNLNTSGRAVWFMPKIEFSPDGTKGYVSVLGDIVGGQDSSYIPVLWEYNVNTGYFANVSEVNMSLSTQLNQYVGGKPTCATTYDLSVDYQGNPHLMCVLGGRANAYKFDVTIPMQVVDITKDMSGNWKMIHIWDQQTLTQTIGLPATTLLISASMQLARSQDGKYIFYTWSDTDTILYPNSNGNEKPNLKGCFYNVQDNLLAAVKDWTYNDPIWIGIALAPKTASRVFETGSTCPGRTFNVPTTACNIPTLDPSTTSDFFYFSDINYDCADANVVPTYYTLSFVGIEQSLNNIHSFKAYPNPTSNILNIDMTLKKADNIQISLVNTAGQTVLNRDVSQTNIIHEPFNVSNLAKGIYFLKVTTSQGVAAEKIVIE